MAPRRRRISLRRLPTNRRPVGLLVIVLVILLASSRFAPWNEPPPEGPSPAELTESIYAVERVVDGDTLVLANQLRVRLIGADTPETVMPNHPVEPFGKEATEFTRRFVADGEVFLQFDGRRADKYGRVLAHVWVGNRMLSEELIRAGLAEAEMQYSYAPAVKDRLRNAQDAARTAGRGIWSR